MLTLDNHTYALMSEQAPRVPWDVFITERLQWKTGEHFALIGPTGQGKTTMLMNILPQRRYVVVFATKPRDETMDALIASGYVKLDRWRSLDPVHYPRRVLWPPARTLHAAVTQRAVIQDAMERIYIEGGWTVAVDETWFLANNLKLGPELKTYLLQARSLKISLVVASQRPAHIPLEVYDQSTHLMFWRDNDERNLSRISGISWRSAQLVRMLVANLERYQVLYVDTRTGLMCRTRCPEVTLLPVERKGSWLHRPRSTWLSLGS